MTVMVLSAFDASEKGQETASQLRPRIEPLNLAKRGRCLSYRTARTVPGEGHRRLQEKPKPSGLTLLRISVQLLA